MEVGGGRDLTIADTMLHADGLRRSVVGTLHLAAASRRAAQPHHHVEDAAAAVVQQQDAQGGRQSLMPQRILVVEEAQVANDAIDTPKGKLLARYGKATGGAERPFNAVNAAVAPHVVVGVDVGQPDGRAVGVVYGYAVNPLPVDRLLEGLHGGHLREGRLVTLRTVADDSQQTEPLPPVGHAVLSALAHLVFQRTEHLLGVAHDDAPQMLEGVLHPTRRADAPHVGVGTLTQIGLQALADDAVAHIEHDVGRCRQLLTGRCQHLVEMADAAKGRQRLVEHDDVAEQPVGAGGRKPVGARLADDNHGPLGLQEVVDKVCAQTVVVGARGKAHDGALIGQLRHLEVEERLRQRHVDVNAGSVVGGGLQEGLVDQAVAVPPCLSIGGIRRRLWLGQRDAAGHPRLQRPWLAERLTVYLVNPRGRPVGRDDHERLVLIVGLGHGGSDIEHGRTGGDAHGDGLVECLGDAQRIEAGRPLVGDGYAVDGWTCVEIVNDGCIAAARTDHGMLDAVLDEQSRQYVDVFF